MLLPPMRVARMRQQGGWVRRLVFCGDAVREERRCIVSQSLRG